MKKLVDLRGMKYALLLVLFSCSGSLAWDGAYQYGTVVRMRTSDCLAVHHGFMLALNEPNSQLSPAACPEYTLVSDKVVFVIVGRSSDHLIPLADVIDFRLYKNELDVRIDDAGRESKFSIKEMILRSEWDIVQKHVTQELTNSRFADKN